MRNFIEESLDRDSKFGQPENVISEIRQLSKSGWTPAEIAVHLADKFYLFDGAEDINRYENIVADILRGVHPKLGFGVDITDLL